MIPMLFCTKCRKEVTLSGLETIDCGCSGGDWWISDQFAYGSWETKAKGMFPYWIPVGKIPTNDKELLAWLL